MSNLKISVSIIFCICDDVRFKQVNSSVFLFLFYAKKLSNVIKIKLSKILCIKFGITRLKEFQIHISEKIIQAIMHIDNRSHCFKDLHSHNKENVTTILLCITDHIVDCKYASNGFASVL